MDYFTYLNKLRESDLINDIYAFIKEVNDIYNLDVLLIPHVSNYKNQRKNDDYALLYKIYLKCIANNLKVKIIPPNYNASQTKMILCRCGAHSLKAWPLPDEKPGFVALHR